MSMGPVTIFGGAGFIGANLAHRLLSQGDAVRLVDNLSRPGVDRNLEWLREQHGARLEVHTGDIRDADAVRAAVYGASSVYHLAAQVSATKSLCDPLLDFEVNARGTVNVLEALRALDKPPALFFTSTDKVYGALRQIPLLERRKRYEPFDDRLRGAGFSETQPLDFQRPHGCSKGAADQYVLDYARTFELPAVVLRLGSTFGPRQHGTEDNGWVAHVLRRSLAGERITICGSGKQVRDLLFIDDLVDALLLARRHVSQLSGRPFNLGGGPENTLSLLELIDVVEELAGQRPDVTFAAERAGDQRYYVSDVRRFGSATGWSARTDLRQGIGELYLWLSLPYERRRAFFTALESPP